MKKQRRWESLEQTAIFFMEQIVKLRRWKEFQDLFIIRPKFKINDILINSSHLDPLTSSGIYCSLILVQMILDSLSCQTLEPSRRDACTLVRRPSSLTCFDSFVLLHLDTSCMEFSCLQMFSLTPAVDSA